MSRTTLSLVLGALLVQTALVHAQTPRYAPATFYETVSVRSSGFSHDASKLLITSDETGVFNLFEMDVASGKRRQLTHSTTDAVRGIGWFPGDDRVLYTADQGGNELNHVYVRELDGSVKDLTPGERLKASFLGWAADDERFWVMTNERDPRHFDVYEYTIDASGKYPRKLLFKNDAAWQIGRLAPDGKKLALIKVATRVSQAIWLADLDAGSVKEPHPVTTDEHAVWNGSPTFSHDGATLYYTSDRGSEFKRLWSVRDGKHTLVRAENWDIGGVGFTRDGGYRILSVNVDAKTSLRVTDTKTGHALALPRGAVGITFSRDASVAAVAVMDDVTPTDIELHDPASGTSRRITRSLTEAIDPRHLVHSRIIRYPSFDGLEIPAVFYRPHGATPEKKAPALVWVHGGPGGQSRVGYRAEIQALVNHGYAILAVNNRGSSGYGKTFFGLDDRRHGEDDLEDCIHGRRWLESHDWIDADRIGIIGGSYGGYMVAAALALEPDSFEMGIDIFGVTNWLRTLNSIPPWWESMRKALYLEMGDPATDEERLRRISPLFHAKRIKKPLLVIQGANDPRVLKVESDEIVAAVKKNGVPCEYVVFDDEGHGFRKKVNRIKALEAYIRFADRHLKGARP